MFGKGLQQQMGIGQAPAMPEQKPQADPMDQINAKLDQILTLLQEDKQEDSSEDQQGGDLNA